jgi:hypothetical protein
MVTGLNVVGWIGVVVGAGWTILMGAAAVGFGGPEIDLAGLAMVLALPVAVMVAGLGLVMVARRLERTRV